MTAVRLIIQAAETRSSAPTALLRGVTLSLHTVTLRLHKAILLLRAAIPRRREDLRARLLRRVPLRHPAILPRQATRRGEAVRTATMVDLTVAEAAAAARAVHRTAAADHFHLDFVPSLLNLGRLFSFCFLCDCVCRLCNSSNYQGLDSAETRTPSGESGLETQAIARCGRA